MKKTSTPWSVPVAAEDIPDTGLHVEIDAPAAVRRALLEERLVVNATGPSTIRLLPPLTVAEDEIDEALARLERVLAR